MSWLWRNFAGLLTTVSGNESPAALVPCSLYQRIYLYWERTAAKQSLEGRDWLLELPSRCCRLSLLNYKIDLCWPRHWCIKCRGNIPDAPENCPSKAPVKFILITQARPHHCVTNIVHPTFKTQSLRFKQNKCTELRLEIFDVCRSSLVTSHQKFPLQLPSIAPGSHPRKKSVAPHQLNSVYRCWMVGPILGLETKYKRLQQLSKLKQGLKL